ncbi:MAG: hypothetical protein NTY48_00295 [Candidatus Diapherotrites archaeon]|nr:hypothetical protein [Candidatus Diapherotrites archaeon]
MDWLFDCRKVFSSIDKETVHSAYKDMNHKKLGYISAKIVKTPMFDAEALLLGTSTEVRHLVQAPEVYNIFINQRLSKIRHPLLRKHVVQTIMIHELLHVESKDLFTLSKEYSRRKKKRIHTNDFDAETFERYNQLRELNGLPKIAKQEYLDEAVHKILQSIGWGK